MDDFRNFWRIAVVLIAVLLVGCAAQDPVLTPPPILAPVAVVPPAVKAVDLVPVAEQLGEVKDGALKVAAAVEDGGRWGDRLGALLAEMREGERLAENDLQALQDVATALEAALDASKAAVGKQLALISDLMRQVRQAVADVAAARVRERTLEEVVDVQNERIQALTVAAGDIAGERDQARGDARSAGGRLEELEEGRNFWRRRAIAMGVGLVLLVVGGGLVWARGGIL